MKTQPGVTINQADPTSTSPINFTVTFSETVTNFAAGDISFAGSTVGGTLTATVMAPVTTYRAVSGMSGHRYRGGERPGRGGDGCGGQCEPGVDEMHRQYRSV